jgi:hypothetical protein
MNSSQAVTSIYHHLKASELMTGDLKPNGDLYKYRRPLNSEMEDVVINSLPFDREALLQGTININIHVPNLKVEINGIVDDSQPDLARLEALTDLALDLLKDVWSHDGQHYFNALQENLVQDSNSSCYMNIRVDFRSVNL